MKSSLHTLAPVLVLLMACSPAVGSSQTAAPQPQQEVRFVTITKFELPRDAEQVRLVMMAIDSIMVPQARMDPNVLSYRILTHNFGANSSEVLVLSEHPSWAAIGEPCEPCQQWFQSRRPAEGTPERAQWNTMMSAFQSAYAGHSDEIYVSQMRRAKQ